MEFKMKVFSGLVIFTILSLAFTSIAEAQLRNRLKDRAKNAAAERVEQKIGNEVEKAAERAVERAWTSVFGDGFGEAGDGFRVPFSLNSNAVTEEAYLFDVMTVMEIQTTHSNGQTSDPIYMKMFFNEHEVYTGTKFSGAQAEEADGDIFIIHDLKNESMVMLMDSEDGKFSFAYDWRQAEQFLEEIAEDDQYQDEDEYEYDGEYDKDHWEGFRSLGTKTIAGLESRGYATEGDGVKMEYWVTEDEGFGIFNMLRANSETKQLRGKVPDEHPVGMMMEMISENIETGEKTVMRVTEIDRNAGLHFQMAEYPSFSFDSGE